MNHWFNESVLGPAPYGAGRFSAALRAGGAFGARTSPAAHCAAAENSEAHRSRKNPLRLRAENRLSMIRLIKPLNLVAQFAPPARQPPSRRQHPQQLTTVRHTNDTRIRDDHDAGVGRRPDQASEALL